jgi:hypothetical protein
VFGKLLDGRAGERIATNIKRLLRPKPEDEEFATQHWTAAGAYRKLHRAYSAQAQELKELRRRLEASSPEQSD